MPNPATVRERRLRKTKAQLIDEIDTLEQRAAAIEAANRSSAPMRAKASDRYLANQELADLARFPSENPNPVLRVMPDGAVLYANDAAIAVNGLLGGRKKSTLARDLAGVCAEASRTAQVRETGFESGDRVFAFSIAPVAGETYINVYGRDISREHAAKHELAEKEAQLRVALDSMPGALVYTDEDLNVVLCNERFSEMYQAPRELLQPGQPYPDFLRYLAEHGYYGGGDVEALVAERIESLRNPSGKTFEDLAPDGRVYRIHRQRAAAGGTVTVMTDITERKRAEEELARKEAQLRIALDNMPGGMMLGDRDLNFVLFNAQYSELCDFPDGLIEVGGSMLDELRFQAERGDFGPGDKDDLIEQVAAIYQRGEAVSFERAIAGSGRTLQINIAPMPEGGYVSILTDITERKRAEAALARQNRVLEVTLENMEQGISMFDAELNLVALNRKFLELWDCPEDEFGVGDPLETFFCFNAARGEYGPGDADAQVAKRIARARKSEARQFEHTRPDGTVLEIRGRPVEGGGFVTTYTDITERKRAEEAVRESEQRLTDAIENISEGFVLFDADERLVLCNSTYKDFYDLADAEVVPGVRFEDLIRRDIEKGTVKSLGDGEEDHLRARVAELGSAKGSFDLELSDGRWMNVRDRRTAAGGYVSTHTDITERKRAEEALVEAKRRAEEASKLVAEKNQMLESLSSKLSKYLSPQVYASIFSGEQSVEIASKRKKLTVFFSDIADFAGTTDSLESEELTNLLNHYLTEMSKIALDHGATIDKYVGDSIIAFFGDPETRGVKEDARACVNMAIAMQRRMRELQSEWLDMGLERPFELRIGINTGFCTVGNFGSEDRMDYTIIGNEVNLAARLESLAEVGSILMAHETHSLVKDTVMAEEGDALTVKGFARPVRTYSIVGLYDDLAEQGRIISREQEGLALKIDRDKLTKKSKAEAIKALEEAVAQLKG